jgi:cell division protein FtsB
MQKMTKKGTRFLHSKSLVMILLIILFLMAVFFSKNWLRDYRVQQEIGQLEAQIKVLEAENLKLTELSQYFSSNFFIEEEARTKLDLKKPEEKSLIIKDFELLGGQKNTNQDNALNLALASQSVVESNYQKWWKYFFRNK